MLLVEVAYIDKIYYCPHMPEEHCDCRKLKIGLVKKAERDLHIDLKHTFLIGDILNDMMLAQKIGVYAILVKTGYWEKVSKRIDVNLKVVNDLYHGALLIKSLIYINVILMDKRLIHF